MKLLKVTLSISLFLAAVHASARDVEKIHEGKAHDVFFGVSASDSGLLAVGGGGKFSTSDDGNDWKTDSIIPADIALLAVSQHSETRLAVGQSGTILRFAADAWQQSVSPTSERLLGVAQGNNGFALAVGAFGTVLRSIDDGISWEKLAIDWQALIQQGYEPHVYNCLIDESGSIYIVGEFGMIARSEDGGDSWSTLHVGDESLFGIAISESGIGYAVGQNGIVLASHDAGNSWHELDVDTEAILLDVAVRSNGDAVIGGIREALMVSGANSRVEKLNKPEFLEDWYVDVATYNNDFFLVGQRAQVVKVSF